VDKRSASTISLAADTLLVAATQDETMSQIADPSGHSSRCQPQPLESKASASEEDANAEALDSMYPVFNRCRKYPPGEIVMSPSLLELPIDKRIQLVEDLWDSIAADQNALPLTGEQRAELDRRIDAYALDRNPGRPADEVIADIRRRL
jgi:putative addiction module component (TIGR02574 family)